MPSNATVYSPDGTISPTWLKDMMLQQQATVASASPAVIPNLKPNLAGAGDARVSQAVKAATGENVAGTPTQEEIERNRQLAAAGDANAIDWLRTLGLAVGGGAVVGGGYALHKALRGRGKKASEVKAAAESNTPKSMPITAQNAKTPAELPIKKNLPAVAVTQVQEEPVTYLPPTKVLPRGQKIPKVNNAMRTILALP